MDLKYFETLNRVPSFGVGFKKAESMGVWGFEAGFGIDVLTCSEF